MDFELQTLAAIERSRANWEQAHEFATTMLGVFLIVASFSLLMWLLASKRRQETTGWSFGVSAAIFLAVICYLAMIILAGNLALSDNAVRAVVLERMAGHG